MSSLVGTRIIIPQIMKFTLVDRFLKTVAALLLFLGCVGIGRGAVTFINTPSAISNTYSGIVTLQISGLTNTETVVVQKYLDEDGSNVVDTSAFLVQQFKLTDGQASVFTDGATSVTNFNVPGDTDGAANGSITANLYPSFDFEQEFVGTYSFVLSSPVGHFSPITNFFCRHQFSVRAINCRQCRQQLHHDHAALFRCHPASVAGWQ